MPTIPNMQKMGFYPYMFPPNQQVMSQYANAFMFPQNKGQNVHNPYFVPFYYPVGYNNNFNPNQQINKDINKNK